MNNGKKITTTEKCCGIIIFLVLFGWFISNHQEDDKSVEAVSVDTDGKNVVSRVVSSPENVATSELVSNYVIDHMSSTNPGGFSKVQPLSESESRDYWFASALLDEIMFVYSEVQPVDENGDKLTLSGTAEMILLSHAEYSGVSESRQSFTYCLLDEIAQMETGDELRLAAEEYRFKAEQFRKIDDDGYF